MATEIIKIIPSILWFILILGLVVVFYKPIRDDLLPNLGGFKALGVELSFVKDSINAAIELAEKSPQWKVEVSASDKDAALRRAKRHLAVFRNAQFLWVDDHPENNLNERKMFRQLRVEIDIAKSTEEALDMLKNSAYDLVISDMKRGEEKTAGMNFLKKYREENKTTPVIFYVGVIDDDHGAPAGAFGITNRPDELLHLTLDALERKR